MVSCDFCGKPQDKVKRIIVSKENIDGCTYGGRYFPTFLEEPCIFESEHIENVKKGLVNENKQI